MFTHKGLMQPRHPRGPGGVHIEAFLPEHGIWCDLHNIPDGKARISPNAKTLIVRYADIQFCDGFGEALSEAEVPYNKNRVLWPPEGEASDTVIHGEGVRLVRVIFWREVRHHCDQRGIG